MAFLPVVQPAGFERSDSKVITLSASSAAGMTSPITPKAAAGRLISGVRFVLNANLSCSATPTGTFFVGGNILGEITLVKGNTTLIQCGNASSNQTAMLDLQRIFHIQTGQVLNDALLPNGTSMVGTLDTGIIPVAIASDVPLVINVQSQPISIPNFTSGSLTVTVYFSYTNAQTPVNAAGAHYDTHIIRVASSSTYNANQEYAISQEFTIASAVSEVWVMASPALDTLVNYFTFKTGSTALLDKVDVTALTNMEQAIGSLYQHIAGFYRAPVPVGTVFLPTGASSTQNQLIANFSQQMAADIVYYLVVQG